FLGVRLGCARCHNHPYEKWTQDDYFGLAAVFAQLRYEPPGRKAKAFAIKPEKTERVLHPRTGNPVAPQLLGAGPAPAAKDHRVPFASWLTTAENPFFARTLVNRIWFHVMGRGLVEPVDDFRESNRPARTLPCECEREHDANLSQALQMIASPLVQAKLSNDQGRIAKLAASNKSNEQIIEELYLAALSRPPSARELQTISAAMAAA